MAGGTSHGRHAGYDGEAETDGERRKDPDMPGSGGLLRFSGLYLWAVSLGKDRVSLRGYASIQEECAADGRRH